MATPSGINTGIDRAPMGEANMPAVFRGADLGVGRGTVYPESYVAETVDNTYDNEDIRSFKYRVFLRPNGSIMISAHNVEESEHHYLFMHRITGNLFARIALIPKEIVKFVVPADSVVELPDEKPRRIADQTYP